MTFSELFSCRESVESRVNQYWTFWSVAVFAVCGWLFSGEQPKFSPEEAWLIVLGLAVFFCRQPVGNIQRNKNVHIVT
ncbi:hypothetical protein OPW36_11920 [Vibrio europaeus]|uniref:hypothetical protein n=1 Tax=Vibrio europaeus TaxID=300876 RepID=UPI00233F19F2|nr:hypothetical protein [Vibrio europaeus]MDC5807919.1 hypothetical protein [Vibrio europaeus]MDC5825421.1 hypothetical protein [Vibrio europaeus]MDC5832709.1 hypothetical protein [Vibrio europaeus]MDC5835620.1 hypothetical protein [Vibrio europaeus]